tara:strand:+ start:214 stop:411 length:198 start_codon:yes stop_codon:yes gene_type:complete
MKKKILNIFNLLLITLTFNACSSVQNFSFYEFFINPNASELILDEQTSAEKPDLESVPEKVEINE